MLARDFFTSLHFTFFCVVYYYYSGDFVIMDNKIIYSNGSCYERLLRKEIHFYAYVRHIHQSGDVSDAAQ